MSDGVARSRRKRRTRAALIRYLNRALLGRVALCGAVLVALMELLALLEKASPILGRHLGIHGIILFALLRLPLLSVEILPLAFLTGALFLLMQMALSSEIAGLWASGLSTAGLYRRFLPSVLIIGFMGTVTQYWLVPISETAQTLWWNRTAPPIRFPTNTGSGTDSPLLFRLRGTIVQVRHVADGGETLLDVTRYERDETGLLTRVQHATRLHYDRDRWTVEGYRALSLDSAKSTIHQNSAGSLSLPVSPMTIIALTQDQPFLTPARIVAVLHAGAPASLPRSAYRMALLNPMIFPLTMATMLLLSFPVIYIPPRIGNRTPLPIYVLAAGLGLVILQGLINALGNAGTLPAPMAVIAGPLPGVLFGLAWIVRMEEK